MSLGPDRGRIGWIQRAGVVEWLMAPGCKPGGLRLYVGSNPTPSTRDEDEGGRMKVEGPEVAE